MTPDEQRHARNDERDRIIDEALAAGKDRPSNVVDLNGYRRTARTAREVLLAHRLSVAAARMRQAFGHGSEHARLGEQVLLLDCMPDLAGTDPWRQLCAAADSLLPASAPHDYPSDSVKRAVVTGLREQIKACADPFRGLA